MLVFRLTRRKYAETLNGKGAAKFGNRWNSKGVEIIYTAESRALAMAEILVHVSLVTLPKDYVMIIFEIPEGCKAKILNAEDLPANWNKNPHITATQKIGDNFVEDLKFLLLKVPSAVVKGDFNVLINPHHADFSKIRTIEIADFPFDERIFE